MEYRILGPLEVRDGDRVCPVGSRKQGAVLAILLLHANEVVSTERLIEELWGEQPPSTALETLRAHVSRLRRALGHDQLVRYQAGGYVLEVGPAELDLERFERLAEQGRDALEQGDPAAAQELLRKALSLWRGAPLADFAYDGFAQREITRLEELRLAALEERIEADLLVGRHAELAAELEALIDAHPLRERLRGQLMLALYRSARQAEALDAYQASRRVLVEELGIEPGRELRELHQAILNQDPALELLAGAGRGAEGSPGVLLGRERELDELVSGLGDAFAGRGRLFLLVGEPGIGKSRLADELIAHARARSARVLVGRCWEAGGAPAYWPWVQSLRAYLRETAPETLRTHLGASAAGLAQLLPELRELLPNLPEPSELDPEGARFELFETVSSLLRRAAESRPLVIVLDDLHAADEPSLLLLQFLTRELRESRLLVVVAYRNVDPIPRDPLTTTLTELAREPVTSSLALTGLSTHDVARFIELSSGEAPNHELAAAIHAETEGNPLFVGEIVRLLTTEGGLHNGNLTRLAIPQSIRDVIARRLRHLSEECNRLLVIASVLGREFRLDALAHAGGITEDELLEVLDEAMAARVVTDLPSTPGHVRFAHVLIRDTLYEGLTTARRVRLHRLAVEALETLYGAATGPHLAELAYHAVAASDFDKALRYAQLAADRALTLLAYEEAARLYETALDALELCTPTDERTRCELLLSVGDAEARAGNTAIAKKAFLAAAELARRLLLPHMLAHAATGYGGRIVWARAGDDDRLVPLLEEGLAALNEEDVELQVRLLARLAGALRDEHARNRRDALSREAVELARRTGNDAALAYALDGRAAAIVAPDTVEECLALGSELCEVAERVGDRERVAAGHAHRRVAKLLVGDIRGAESDLAAERDIAEELRQPAQLWQVCAASAMLALAAGRLGEAEELVPQVLALGERELGRRAVPPYQLQRYTLCDLRGNLEDVEPAIRDLVAEYPARPAFCCALAHLYAQLGRLAEAKSVLDEIAENNFSTLPFDLEWLYGMSLLAETCVRLPDNDSATVLYSLLRPWAGFNVADPPEGVRGSVARYLGLLTAKLGRWDDAARHFEDALKMNERMGLRPWLAHTQHDYAQMLLSRGSAGDRPQARELLSEALPTYEELGMEAYAASAAELTADAA